MKPGVKCAPMPCLCCSDECDGRLVLDFCFCSRPVPIHNGCNIVVVARRNRFVDQTGREMKCWVELASTAAMSACGTSSHSPSKQSSTRSPGVRERFQHVRV